jgi:hypothetical protein
MKKGIALLVVFGVSVAGACKPEASAPVSTGQPNATVAPMAGELSPAEARSLGHDAYLYAFPIVENYLSIYQFALDPSNSQYKGPPNEVHNVARVFTPKDTGVVTPNSDTPYSFLIMDLRAEPIVVTLPAIHEGRYYSLQLVDLYSHNVDYLGTRTDGNGGGKFLIAGPDWKGETPASIKRVVRIPTQLMFSQFRTQLLDAKDISEVKTIQAGYKAEPLSAYLKQPLPPTPPKVDFPPITREMVEKDFFRYANFLLQFCPPLSGEEDLRRRFERIGLKAGAPWPPAGIAQSLLADVEAGKQAAHDELNRDVLKITTSVGLFGTPQEMAGKYKERALGALGGLYGNSAEEAVYPAYMADATGQPFDTSKHNYKLTFAPGQLPPVDAFWSVTMYDGKTRFLVDNPLNRYLINSTMLPALKKNSDGGITLYLQNKPPARELESNWLPAPNGQIGVVMRLYLPKPVVLSGNWMT